MDTSETITYNNGEGEIVTMFIDRDCERFVGLIDGLPMTITFGEIMAG